MTAQPSTMPAKTCGSCKWYLRVDINYGCCDWASGSERGGWMDNADAKACDKYVKWNPRPV